MLRSDLCDYSDAYFVVKWKISVTGTKNSNRINKKLVFKNNAWFRACITKINNTFTDNAEVVVPLKCLSYFWRSLDLLLINYEIELDLIWERNSIIKDVLRTFRAVDPKADPLMYELTSQTITGGAFQISNANHCTPVVTLSINDNIKLLEIIKQKFKRTNSWNKFRSETRPQAKNNNLDYLIDPSFWKIRRLFVLSFKKGNDDPTINSFDRYYKPLVEIKGF